jgi:phosphatidylglycerophosphate synthase
MQPSRVPKPPKETLLPDSSRAGKGSFRWAKHIPNLLTSFRILLAALFPIVPVSLRPLVVGIALLTEYLDGALSRWLHAQTLVGQILDPIADKLFFGSVAITFLAERSLALDEILLLGIRDLLVICAVSFTILRGSWYQLSMMKPRFFGKLTTALQYGAFINLVFSSHLSPLLAVVTGIAGVLAAGQYFIQLKNMKLRAGF